MNSEVLPTASAWIRMPKDAPSWPPQSPSPPPSSSSTAAAPAPGPAAALAQEGHHQARLDLFHKLGYSTAQVQGVLRKFGPGMDTDKLLEKLVGIGAEEAGPQAVRLNVPLPQWDVRAERAPEEAAPEEEDPLRPIVIDGSNVAMSHGNKEVFSCLGIQLAVNFFLERGHRSITVFVPSWRSEKPRPDVPISDQHILRELERKKLLVFTPSKRVGGKRIVCHDDRYIVKLAFDTDGLIISNDMYRDLQRENPDWKRFIEDRLIMYSFVNNKFMPPDDPMGRHGPSLDDLRRKCPVVQKRQPCPYGRKCTFGNKCRFSHPERPKQSNQTLADELRSRHSPPHSAPYAPPPCPAPGHSLSLVEDMAKKLTLGTPPKRDHHSDGKGGHSRKSCSRKDKKSRHASLEQGSVANGESQERQLDSGLGSIDPLPYDATYGSGMYSQPQSAPCSYHLPDHHHHHHGFQAPHGMARSEMNLAYSTPPFPSYGPYSGGVPAYSHPQDFAHGAPRQMFWSDPYAAAPRAVSRPPPEESPAGAGQASDQREGVRKKLMAIFSAQLVDAAMGMNPQLLDPQRLAAEILRLQSQGL